MTTIQFIQNQTNIAPKSIEATIQLLIEDCTIPFISRYRKDQTGNLDEVQIEAISKLNKHFEEIVKRKESILKSIEEQNVLSPELKSKIENSFDLQELEDLYLPYKKKKKTKADVARENGLEPLAKIIMSQKNDSIEFLASNYLNANVKNEDEALQGARDIIAEWINENIFIRKNLRRLFQRKAVITTKVVKTKKEDEAAQKFSQYFDWEEAVSKAPSHRLLAMLRAEAEGFVKLNVAVEKEEALDFIEENIIKNKNSDATEHLELAIKDSYKRLLEPAISNETLQEAKAKADSKAIDVFSDNLRQLLLASPLGEKRILAIDPGYRTGCKVVCLDEKAYQQAAAFIRIKDGKNPLDNSAVHPEAYPIVEKMAKDLGVKTTDLIANAAKIAQIKPENYITSEIGILTLKDILKELEKPGLDPRKAAKIFEFDPNVRSISDLRSGMILPGIVNNITAFGCFVDVGIKESGLVHISQLKEGYVADVNEVVKIHQHVQVKVIEVDEARKRIQLTMIL